jgi:hypothetical protein
MALPMAVEHKSSVLQHIPNTHFPSVSMVYQSSERTVPWVSQLVTGLSVWRPGFHPRPAHVRFVLNKVALGQIFL